MLRGLPRRRVVGLACLLALVVIGIGVLDLELPASRAGPPVPGVRAAGLATVVRSGLSAPPGELAFLAVEPSGNLTVSDRRRRSLLRFDAAGQLISEWGPRLGETTIDEPAGVVAQGDRFYVVDRATPRLLSLDVSGRVQSVVDLQPFQPYGLNGLAADAQGNLYVADTGRNRILIFSSRGAFVRQIGRGGSGLGEFTQPMALAFAPDGGFFVADWENARIERWSAALAATDAFQTGFRPYSVAVDGLGRVYVPDAVRGRVQVFSPQGNQLAELGGSDTPIDVDEPRQVALPPTNALNLFVLGSDGIVRVDLVNAPAPAVPQDFDLPSLVAILAFGGLVAAAVLVRRRRRLRPVFGTDSVEVAALDRPVGLGAKNGTHR
jgi:DNA-binding beta-propeller fold protein YncE